MQYKKLKVGLLTPYTGGNFGDGAIQEAVIHNIRERYPEAEIFGINQHPYRTQQLHHIPCYAISSFSTSHYGVFKAKTSTDTISSPKMEAQLVGRIKWIAKQIPFVSGILRSAYRVLSNILQEARYALKCRRILKGTDLLVVSGGGQLDDYWGGPWGHPFALFKWALIAGITKTKFAFMSVGLCSSDSVLTRLLLKNALKRASYRSYRDWRSKRLLETMKFTRSDPVCPDLAFSYSLAQNQGYQINKRNGRVVGVSPIAYLSQHSWPRQNQCVYRSYITKLAGFVSEILKRDFDILLFHTDDPDRAVINELLGILDKEYRVKPDRLYRPKIHNVKDLALHLSAIDFAVASRLHGILLSHLAEKPVLAISYDRKVDTYMADMGQRDYCLDIHDFDVEALTRTFDALLLHRREIVRKTVEKVSSYKKTLVDQYDRLLR